jgi:hypothetical protein
VLTNIWCNSARLPRGSPKICRRRQHFAAAGAIALWNVYHCPRWPELRIFNDVVNAVHRSPKHIRFVSERSLALFERERCEYLIKQPDEFRPVFKPSPLAVKPLIVDEIVDSERSG